MDELFKNEFMRRVYNLYDMSATASLFSTLDRQEEMAGLAAGLRLASSYMFFGVVLPDQPMPVDLYTALMLIAKQRQGDDRESKQ